MTVVCVVGEPAGEHEQVPAARGGTRERALVGLEGLLGGRGDLAGVLRYSYATVNDFVSRLWTLPLICSLFGAAAAAAAA